MNRAEILRARRKRKRILLSIVFSLVFGVLVAAGVALGAVVGVAAEKVPEMARNLRETPVVQRILPAKEPPLESNKKAPPKPVDASGPAVACAASSVTLNVTADRTDLEPGVGVFIHVTVTHTGRVPCLVNGGLENLRLRLVDDVGNAWWTNTDCGYNGTRQLLMGPGYNFALDASWDGHTAAPGICQTDQPLPAGTWQLIASLAEVAYSDSAPATVIVHGPTLPVPAPEPVPEPEIMPVPEPIPAPDPDLLAPMTDAPEVTG